MCVYQLLKKHYSRYDLDTVSSITGTPKADLLKVYETYASTAAPDKVGTSMYAMGWTQHTVGTQNIIAMSIIQQLLGNMGMAGGGINALRGESNVQGSTDYGLLFHILPSYLPVPVASKDTLEAYVEAVRGRDQGAAERELALELATSTSSATSRRSSATTRRRRTSSATSGCRSSTTARTPPGS